jgi:hypothetical protein
VNPARLALERAQLRLIGRLDQLDARLGVGEDVWHAYAEAAVALAAIVPTLAPGASGEFLTTRQLAARMQISEKTLRRKAKAGLLEPVRFGKRGRAALRWAAR